MITPTDATAIIGFPDNSLTKEQQCHQLANRAFRYLFAVYDQVDHPEQLTTFMTLVKAVQAMRPEWVCEGPYTIADNNKVFVGPNNYMIIFNPVNLQIYFGRFKGTRPSPDWKPDWRQAIDIEEMISRIQTI